MVLEYIDNFTANKSHLHNRLDLTLIIRILKSGQSKLIITLIQQTNLTYLQLVFHFSAIAALCRIWLTIFQKKCV